jgi:hypothetical protein
MQIDITTILDFLQTSGQHDEAEQASQKLPGRVDHEQHAGLLEELGINPQELVKATLAPACAQLLGDARRTPRPRARSRSHLMFGAASSGQHP